MMLAFACALYGQSWDSLRELKPGDRIKVLETGGREQKGAFTAFSDTAISLQAGKSEVAIERARVRRVQVQSSSRRLRNAAIGIGIGIAIGVAVDGTLGKWLRNEGTESARPLMYIVPIGLFGGIAAAPAGYRTVYKVR
jgi:hypothetical protein